MDDDSHYRLYGIFLLNQLNGKEILITEDIWAVLETLNDYEKLYLTYLVQGLTLNKLDFIHRGMQKLYQFDQFRNDTSLFVQWIDQAESIIADQADLTEVERYLGAYLYLYYQQTNQKLTKKQIKEWFDISHYKLDKTITYILSI